MESSRLFTAHACWDIDERSTLDKLKSDAICYRGEIGSWWQLICEGKSAKKCYRPAILCSSRK